ncbi:MAG: hypothetical protein AB7S78_08885 [Candidatus Omnitrophota bacterium]
MKMNDQKKLQGVTLFSVLLIVYSLWQLALILDFPRYKYIFQFLPDTSLLIRFSGSITLRILTIILAAGILSYKNRFRKALIFLSIYNILTVYWKHPYEAFVNWDRYYQISPEKINTLIYRILGNMAIDYQTIKIISVAAACISDVLFYGAIIYYFTRPPVKQRFT